MHLMVDLETLGTSPDSVVLSAGAVFFNKKDGIVLEAYSPFNLDCQLESGRKIDANTLSWWLKQDDKAKKVFTEVEKAQRYYFLYQFIDDAINDCIADKPFMLKNLKVWGMGANFDVVIMEDDYRRHGEDIPWAFWNVNCFRMFNKLTKCRDKRAREGVFHNALDDARYQARCVLDVIRGQK